jgi:hypothetical protein
LYIYIAGGPFDPLDDSQFCPKCQEVIINALKKVPPAVEKVWSPVSDIEAKQDIQALESKEARTVLLRSFRSLLASLTLKQEPVRVIESLP